MRRSVSEVWPSSFSDRRAGRRAPSALRRSLSEVTESLPAGGDDPADLTSPPAGDDDGDGDGGVITADLMTLTEVSSGDPSTAQSAQKLIHLYQVVERLTNKCYVTDRNANNTAEKDLENKFSSLALAFKTDRLTLQERLDVQRRHRDQAEYNLELETQRFRDQLMQLSQTDEDRPAQLKSLQRQVEIFKQISQRLSSTAEVLGAVQQELRVSHAVEVMTQHVENLRHLYDREHAELEEARRVLASHKLVLQEPGGSKQGPPGRRRASIAVFAAARAGGAANGEVRPATVAPLGGSPANQMLLKRRRNSADGKSFDSITEEKEEERDQEDGETRTESAAEELYRPDDEEELRSHVESVVSDELATLRSEQEQLANDLRTLLSRQTGTVIEHTSIAGRMVWELVRAWPYSREETAQRVRFCCGGLFLLLAVLVLLVPPAFGLHQPDRPTD